MLVHIVVGCRVLSKVCLCANQTEIPCCLLVTLHVVFDCIMTLVYDLTCVEVLMDVLGYSNHSLRHVLFKQTDMIIIVKRAKHIRLVQMFLYAGCGLVLLVTAYSYYTTVRLTKLKHLIRALTRYNVVFGFLALCVRRRCAVHCHCSAETVTNYVCYNSRQYCRYACLETIAVSRLTRCYSYETAKFDKGFLYFRRPCK